MKRLPEDLQLPEFIAELRALNESGQDVRGRIAQWRDLHGVGNWVSDFIVPLLFLPDREPEKLDAAFRATYMIEHSYDAFTSGADWPRLGALENVSPLSAYNTMQRSSQEWADRVRRWRLASDLLRSERSDYAWLHSEWRLIQGQIVEIGREAIFETMRGVLDNHLEGVRLSSLGREEMPTLEAIERFSDKIALTDGYEHAYVVFHATQGSTEIDALSIAVPNDVRFDDDTGKPYTTFVASGDVHFDLHGNHTEPWVATFTKNVTNWAKIMAGQRIGSTFLTPEDIRSYVHAYKGENGRYPTKLEAASFLLSATTTQALDYHLKLLGIRWKDVWRG